MNKNGFTLVELLGVIIVLAIVSGIVVVSMTGIIGTGKNSAYKAYEKTFALSAQNYLTDFPDEEPVESSLKKIYLRDLLYNGYLEKFEDPNGGNCNDLINNSYVLVGRHPGDAEFLNNYKLEYRVCLICLDGSNETYKSDDCDKLESLVQILARYVKYTPRDGITCKGGKQCENVQLILDKIASMVKK